MLVVLPYGLTVLLLGLVTGASADTGSSGGFILTSDHIAWIAGAVVTAVSLVGGYYKIRAGMRAEAAAQAAEIRAPIEKLTKAVETLESRLQAELYPLHDAPLAAQVRAVREGQDAMRVEIKALEADNAKLSAEIDALRTAQAATPAAIRALGRELAGRLGPIEAGLRGLVDSPPRGAGG